MAGPTMKGKRSTGKMGSGLFIASSNTGCSVEGYLSDGEVSKVPGSCLAGHTGHCIYNPGISFRRDHRGGR